MIIRRPHPDKPDVQVFVPLRYDAVSRAWVSMVVDEGYFLNPVEAGQVCLTYILTKWMDTVKECRVLRALCEHPDFEFDEDKVDSDMIRRHAQAVCERLELMSDDFHRLFQEPGDNDALYLQGQSLRGRDIPNVLIGLKELQKLLGRDPDAVSADELFFDVVIASWAFAQEKTGTKMTSKGCTKVVAWLTEKLSECLDDDDAPNDNAPPPDWRIVP